jgi:hypothetical protein
MSRRLRYSECGVLHNLDGARLSRYLVMLYIYR